MSKTKRSKLTLINCTLLIWSLLIAGPIIAQQNTIISIETSKGSIIVALFDEKAPITTRNFVQYVEDGFYTDTLFHRVVKDTFIQGGGFKKGVILKNTRPPIRNEATNGLQHKKGTFAMARTTMVDSATSQFFINIKDNPEFNHAQKTPIGYGYTVFGEVVDGLSVVEKISAVSTTKKGLIKDLPQSAVWIKNIKIIRNSSF